MLPRFPGFTLLAAAWAPGASAQASRGGALLRSLILDHHDSLSTPVR